MRDDRLVKLVLGLLEPGDQIRLDDKVIDIEKIEGDFIYDCLGREVHYSEVREFILYGEKFYLTLDRDSFIDDETEDIFKDPDDPKE